MADGTSTVRGSLATVTTIFTTEHAFDAGLAGYDGPASPADGGVSVVFDGRHMASVTIYGQEGEVTICGYSAIKQISDAFLEAEKMARRMARAA